MGYALSKLFLGNRHFIAINKVFLPVAIILFTLFFFLPALIKVSDIGFDVGQRVLAVGLFPLGTIYLLCADECSLGMFVLLLLVQSYFWSALGYFVAPYIKNRKQSLIGAIKTLKLFALLLILAGCAFFALAFFAAPRIYDNGYYDLSARLLNVSLFPLKTVCRWFDYYPADTVAGLKSLCVLQAFFWSLVAWPVVYYAKKWFKK